MTERRQRRRASDSLKKALAAWQPTWKSIIAIFAIALSLLLTGLRVESRVHELEFKVQGLERRIVQVDKLDRRIHELTKEVKDIARARNQILRAIQEILQRQK